MLASALKSCFKWEEKSQKHFEKYFLEGKTVFFRTEIFYMYRGLLFCHSLLNISLFPTFSAT